MSNVIADRIAREAEKLVTELYSVDVAEMRRKLIVFNAKAMNIATGAESIVDPFILKIVESKYTTAIILCLFVVVFGAGYVL